MVESTSDRRVRIRCGQVTSHGSGTVVWHSEVRQTDRQSDDRTAGHGDAAASLCSAVQCSAVQCSASQSHSALLHHSATLPFASLCSSLCTVIGVWSTSCGSLAEWSPRGIAPLDSGSRRPFVRTALMLQMQPHHNSTHAQQQQPLQTRGAVTQPHTTEAADRRDEDEERKRKNLCRALFEVL